MADHLKHLFEPGRIGSVGIRNRLVMAPMGTFSTDYTGCPSERTVDYYAERARGGVGLIIVEATNVLYEARTPNHLRLYCDDHIAGLRRLAQAVHKEGSSVALQLAHFGPSLPVFLGKLGSTEDVDMVGPSPVEDTRHGVVLREASKDDIKRIVEAFALAAHRAKEAGFDAVEFHAAHGLLVSYFLSPFTNKRTDEYGGSTENRARFACEIVARARELVGPDFVLMIRLSGSEFIEGGNTLEDTIRQAQLLQDAGVDAFHVSASTRISHQWQFLSYISAAGALLDLSGAIRREVSRPVIAVGKLGDPLVAEEALESGKADFVAMGRALIADPELPRKASEGRLQDIRKCVYCNNCLTAAVGQRPRLLAHGISCTVNPAVLRETGFKVRPAPMRKRVMVVGGGLAGMEAARVLAQRGHQVSLYEKEDRLGGQWNLACRQDVKSRDYPSLTRYLADALAREGVRVFLGSDVTPEVVREAKPDAVVVATGAVAAVPSIPGADGGNAVQAVDVIAGKAGVGPTAVVIGGRHLGMEVSEWLARQGHKVSLVSRSRIGRDVQRSLYQELIGRLVAEGVHLYPNSPAKEIRPNGVYIAYNSELLFLRSDTVVLATGFVAQKELGESLQGLVGEMHRVGDCVEPRDAMEAISEGAEIARLV